MTKYIDKNMVFLDNMGAKAEPEIGKIIFGIKKGTKINPLDEVIINNNRYIKFNSLETKGVKLSNDIPLFCWVLVEGIPTTLTVSVHLKI
jgi:hypothetical protein